MLGLTPADPIALTLRNVCATSDGGLVIVGDMLVQAGETMSQDIFYIKIDGTGSVVWMKSYAANGKLPSYIKQASDGGYYYLANYTPASGSGGGVVVGKISADGLDLGGTALEVSDFLYAYAVA